MHNLLTTLTKIEMDNIKIASLEKEQILFSEGEMCECIGIVLSGVVDIVSYSYGGNEIIFNHLEEDMVFGGNLIFSTDPLYKGAVIAKKLSKVALIYKKQLLFLLQNNSEFLLEFLKYQSDMGKGLNGQIKLLSLESAEERFYYYAHSNGNIIRYKTITQLAASLHLQRETLSRLITRLVKENKIIKEPHLIKIINKFID